MPEHRSRDSAEPPEECANCGGAIPRDAKACPGCGADERTGWRESDRYDGLDLPEEAFADETTLPRKRSPRRVNGIAWYWWLLAIGLVLLLVFAIR